MIGVDLNVVFGARVKSGKLVTVLTIFVAIIICVVYIIGLTLVVMANLLQLLRYES